MKNIILNEIRSLIFPLPEFKFQQEIRAELLFEGDFKNDINDVFRKKMNFRSSLIKSIWFRYDP